MNGLEERVILSGHNSSLEARLHALGFSAGDFQTTDGETLLKSTGLQATPVLVLIDPQGRVAYSGGYANGRPGSGVAIDDLAIWNKAVANETQKSKPVFGCANGQHLRRALDPLHLKYAQE